ncbi:ABC transporter substrate-binding protein [Actinomadura kijaniata]|uniref:ABC transporter substrate-binding protein n=1 Tax=Actinomadura kijaniata TaxID=46161 RepID=UPI000AF4D9FF|nr:ABC transporter substrate-binding protein [Actinomadura kijaniata]
MSAVRTPGRRALAALVALIALGTSTGCGGGGPARSDTGRTAAGFPVRIDNCGVTTTYRRPPTRAVTLNQHTTEIMLALGLERSMVGTAYLDDRILPEYRGAYGRIKVLAGEYPSYETLLAAEPDFVYGGFTSAFADKDGRGRGTLAKAGINSHLSVESCPNGPVTVETVDAEIRAIAQIFGVRDRGEQVVARMRTTLEGVRKRVAGVRPPKVFVYDSGDKTAFTAGGGGVGSDLIRRAGGTNVFGDLPKAFGDVSFEQVAERAPDVVVIYDYGRTTVEEKKRFLLGNPALKDVPAIRDRRFAVLPLSSTVLGVRVPGAVESLARQLHPERFR